MEIVTIILSVVSIVIAVYSACKSRDANNIARKANQLVETQMSYSQSNDKVNKINEIIEYIVQNWKAKGGAREALLYQWRQQHNCTIEDFNFIWQSATERVKLRSPKESAESIINQDAEK